MTKHITVNSISEAWQKVNEIFPTDYEYDNGSRERAGYEIYRSTATEHNYDYICDLGDRLEINLSNNETVNIWIEETEPETAIENAPNTTYFNIELTAKNGEMRFFTDYNLFVSSWRFWFNSGETCKDEECAFESIMNSLQSINIHESHFEFVRCGLLIKFTFFRW